MAQHSYHRSWASGDAVAAERELRQTLNRIAPACSSAGSVLVSQAHVRPEAVRMPSRHPNHSTNTDVMGVYLLLHHKIGHSTPQAGSTVRVRSH